MAPGMTPVLEHADFFVFNKPAGISFHSEDGAGFFALLAKEYPNEALFPVHRLDKITSGLLLIARTKPSARQLGQLFESHAIKKTYIALSDCKPSKKQGAVSGDMQRTRNGNWKLLQQQEQSSDHAFYFTLTGSQPAAICAGTTNRAHTSAARDDEITGQPDSG
jgi:tRNA pseudouridine32 synthase/23S rRNA pseudouridine746 synthase